MFSRVPLVTGAHDDVVPTVSENEAVWSVLAPSAVTVIGKLPVGVDAEVAMVSVEEPPDWTVAGLNVAVAPAGRPEADSEMDCALPDVVVVLTATWSDCPGWTVPALGFRFTEKSLPCVVATASFHSAYPIASEFFSSGASGMFDVVSHARW